MHRETQHEKRNPKRTGKKRTKPEGKPQENKLEGEGSYEAGRRYDDHAREFVSESGVEPAAEEARRELDEDPESLRRAEEEGRRGPK